MVTWESLSQSPDSSDHGVFAQLFDASGNRSAANSWSTKTHCASSSSSTVSTLDDGNFVVTWTSYNPDDGTSNIYARAFAPGPSAATAVTDEFIVGGGAIMERPPKR